MSFADDASTRVQNQLSSSNYALSDVLGSLSYIQQLLLAVQNDAKNLKTKTPPDIKLPTVSLTAAQQALTSASQLIGALERDTSVLRDAVSSNSSLIAQTVAAGLTALNESGSEASQRQAMLSSVKSGDGKWGNRSVRGAIHTASAQRAIDEFDRRDAEIGVLSKDGAKNFLRPSGTALGRILSIRQEVTRKHATNLSELLLKQASVNADLKLEWAMAVFKDAERIARATASFNTAVAAMIGELLAEYDQSNGVARARRTVAAAKTVADAYGQANSTMSTVASAYNQTYQFSLLKDNLKVVSQELEAMAYKVRVDTTIDQRRNIAAALASTTATMGTVANSLMRTTGVSGSFTERGFS